MTVLCSAPMAAGSGYEHLLWAAPFNSAADCPSTLPYVLVTASDYHALTDLSTLFNQFFAFDPVLFESVMEWSLLSFVTGHCLGRLLQVWRKSF